MSSVADHGDSRSLLKYIDGDGIARLPEDEFRGLVRSLDEHHQALAIALGQAKPLREALRKASEALFDACPYIDQWECRMPVRRAAEAARKASDADLGKPMYQPTTHPAVNGAES